MDNRNNPSDVFQKRDIRSNLQKNEGAVTNAEPKEAKFQLPEIEHPSAIQLHPTPPKNKPPQPKTASERPKISDVEAPKEKTGVETQKEKQMSSAPSKPVVKPPSTTTKSQRKYTGDINSIDALIVRGMAVVSTLVLIITLIASLFGG